MIITGSAVFASDFTAATGEAFPEPATRRYQIAGQLRWRSSGTGPDQVDARHIARYTFVASTPQEIDILALVGPFVRHFFAKMEAGADAAATLTFGGAAANPWLPVGGILYPPTSLSDGCAIFTAPGLGAPVTSGSKMLKMTPSAHAFSVRLFILGATA